MKERIKWHFLEHKREKIKTLTSSTKNEGTISEGPLQKHRWKLLLSIQLSKLSMVKIEW